MAWKAYNTINGQIMGEVSDAPGANATDYLTDALGSVVATVSGGKILNTYRWSGYGQQVHKTGIGRDPKFLWVGAWGYRAGLPTYIRSRHYVSKQASWTTVDPMWPWQRSHVYAVNPVTQIDPTGLVPVIVEFHAFIGGWRGSWLPEYWPVNVSGYYFKGDERDFGRAGSSRLFAAVTIDSMDIGKATPNYKFNVGTSHRRQGASGVIESRRGILRVVFVEGKRLNCSSFLRFIIEGRYPFVRLAPAIMMEVRIQFTTVSPMNFSVSFSGSRTAFPDSEAYVKVPAFSYFKFLHQSVSIFDHPADGLMHVVGWEGSDIPPGPSGPCCASLEEPA